MSDVDDKLNALRRECLDCRRCAIGGNDIDGRPCNVFSNLQASAVMVVGQNPGAEEVRRGVPFVGLSGQFFDRAVDDVLGLDRSAFYICNTVRCFTSGNRAPVTSEIEHCRHFLYREVEVLKPRCLVALGSLALRELTGLHGITKHHGRVRFSLRYNLPVLPLFHPSPLNMGTAQRRSDFYRDLEALGPLLEAVSSD